jgi:hypothetical protein
MAKLAFMTIGLLHAPTGDPQVQGFVDRIDENFSQAAESEGFLGRSVWQDDTEQHSWGPQTVPEFFQKDEWIGRRPATLSLWQDLESVFAFAYHGVHGEALSKRKEWFVKPEWPTYVAWWVSDDHTPSWEEAVEHYEHLQVEGPTPQAFDFKQSFDSHGRPLKIDRDRVRQLVNRDN